MKATLESQSSKEKKAGVFLVDDHGVVHFGVKMLVDGESSLAWRGGAREPAEALRLISASPPDLLVLDLVLGGRDRLDLLGELRAAAPDTKILVYSSLPEATYGARVFRMGAWAFVAKSGDFEELRQALLRVAAGGIWASPELLREVSGAGKSPGGKKQADGVAGLSDRELHVFRLLGQGMRPRSIADELSLSVKTIHTYCERLKEKLACNSLEILQKLAAEEREW